jgi:hypothetical protein
MKLRHAAALALASWYLMAPQVNLPSSKISEWIHLETYDSSRECETGLAKMIKAADATAATKMNDPAIGFAISFHLAECIASDDPRLAK